MCNFIEKLNELYNIILQPLDIIYKKVAIEKYKNLFYIEKNQYISLKYYNINACSKDKGVVYTPEEIAFFMVKNLIEPDMVIHNPYIKIVDPACGSGNLIIPCFIHLKETFKNNLKLINETNNINLKEENIDKHIIENNLYGFDIDKQALKILIIDLFYISGHVSEMNFLNKDFLIDEISCNFDVFIANPPYVGHKSVHKDYSKLLKEKYKGIYKDKGDISYCFFQNALEQLKSKGKLAFITSRYFIESPSGEELRRIITDKTTLYKIVDFYGVRPFKNIGIDPVIIFLTNNKFEQNKIQIIKPIYNKGKKKKEFYESVFLENGEGYKKFYISNDDLSNKGWILIDEKEKSIVNKIQKKSVYILSDICESYQGIITGCDKAFVVDSDTINRENLEENIIKPWIKSSFIYKNKIIRENKFIIYSNLIEEEKKYPNAINHIKEYKEKLIGRRECKSGIRLWYQLQWGRVQQIFEKEKIIFPYKGSNNRFALDKGSYFSADVYSLVLKEDSLFSYEYLLCLLNSKLYEFYFKTFGKKLGEDLFEYYPNSVMKLCIPFIEELKELDEQLLYRFFDLTEDEIKIIENNYVK